MNGKSTGALRKAGLFLAVIVCAAAAFGCVLGAWYFLLEDIYCVVSKLLAWLFC